MILSEEAFNMIQSQLARAIARAEKAEAALEVTADTLRDCHQELEASGYAYDHPSLIRYRLAVDNARTLRDVKGEWKK